MEAAKNLNLQYKNFERKLINYYCTVFNEKIALIVTLGLF